MRFLQFALLSTRTLSFVRIVSRSRRSLIKFLVTLSLVLILVSCASTPDVELLSTGKSLDPEKAYFGGTFYYNWHVKNVDFILASDVGATMSIAFRGSTMEDVDIYETEPGNYEMKGVRNYDTWWKKLIDTPPPIRGVLEMKPGTITYLGDYTVMRQQTVIRGVWHEVEYRYDLEQFEEAVREQYTVPVSMVFQ